MPHPLILRRSLKSAIRLFFDERKYLEVDTPVLVKQPGTEVHVDYFSTEYAGFNEDKTLLHMRSSPELHMKQLLFQGLEKIYQLGPCFRNQGEYTKWHHPEFTLLEWYEVGLSLEQMIKETDLLIRFCEEKICDEHKESGEKLPRLELITVKEAFLEFAGIPLIDQDKDLAKKAAAAGCRSPLVDDDFETAFFKVLMEKIEPALKKQRYACLYDYPESQAILAKVEGGVAKRFEFYIDGIEICNAFDECLDAGENRLRMEDANQKRLLLGKKALPLDEYFLASLENTRLEASGNALGFDRLLSCLLQKSGIEQAIPFRHQFPCHHP